MQRLTATAYLVQDRGDLMLAINDWDTEVVHRVPQVDPDAFPMIACMSMCDGRLRVESISEKTIGQAGYFKQAFPSEATVFSCDMYACHMTASYTESGRTYDVIVKLDDEGTDQLYWCENKPDDDTESDRIEGIIKDKCRTKWEEICAT